MLELNNGLSVGLTANTSSAARPQRGRISSAHREAASSTKLRAQLIIRTFLGLGNVFCGSGYWLSIGERRIHAA
jgi:hypothetical protein